MTGYTKMPLTFVLLSEKCFGPAIPDCQEMNFLAPQVYYIIQLPSLGVCSSCEKV